ncbi:MAG: sensor histidine kinase [Calditrichia bacterium]
MKNNALLISDRKTFIEHFTGLLKSNNFSIQRTADFESWYIDPDKFSFDICFIDNPDQVFNYELFFNHINRRNPQSIVVNVGSEDSIKSYNHNLLFGANAIDDSVGMESFVKNMGEFLKRANTRTELAAMLIHDIRSPLNSLIAYIQLLLNNTFGELNEGQSNMLEKAMVLGDQTLDMLEDMNEVYKSEQFSFTLDKDIFPIRKVIENAMLNLWVQADRKDIKIRKEVPAKFPLMKGDAFQIQRIFVNLIENAIKYSPEGSQINISAIHENKRMAGFSIADNGGGIPEDKLKSIFRKSYRIKDSAAFQKGHGLGLYICKLIIKAHNGTIEAQNNDIGGVTFNFTLPIQTEGK